MSAIFICGGGPVVPDRTDCPHVAEHTPRPDGYADWHEWAGRMSRQGYRQKRCPGCDKLVIWTLTRKKAQA